MASRFSGKARGSCCAVSHSVERLSGQLAPPARRSGARPGAQGPGRAPHVAEGPGRRKEEVGPPRSGSKSTQDALGEDSLGKSDPAAWRGAGQRRGPGTKEGLL